ncbi:cell cycle checkpoint control protein rad9a [Mortierella sp. AD094]|nr:cell cycle checkpoint control protein rad9a [Mortierella sp. AD094]
MRAIIPSLSVKGFQAVLLCLAKIGDDIVVEARPDRFILSTINITRSAFATFTFTRTFFESYHLDTTAEAIKHDASGPYLRCTVLAKALVSACKIRGNVEQKIEKCCLFMNAAEGVGENCRFIKIHKLLYESCPEPLQVIDSIESCPSSWRLPAAALIGFTENFSAKAEEISMTCTQEAITFKTFKDASEEDPGGSKKYGTTVVPMSRNSMEYYRLQDEIEITFSLKEFKAIVAFAVALRLPLEGYFDARCRPLLLTVVSENIVSGNFALATVISEDESAEQNQRERTANLEETKTTSTYDSRTNISQGDVDLTQPENALFLDDDAEWLGALDDLEMEEVAAKDTAHPGPHADSDAPTLVGLGHGQELEEDAYEIEDEFLPSTDRNPKRLRFNFDEDD